ncbi:prepilin peptidase CpaA [Neorhizobium galegae]|uniref:A24 family peptidase n=1 Tax=Neorhizobium galegae TaxID=399 RepID=UPI001AE307F4|nr:prepilin peptidase [Neorhizobium galegae]MBP2548387.1 prepilin peptidase CpaA [Neorhizobium galegae]
MIASLALGILPLGLAFAATSDLLTMKIPNAIPLTLFLAFFPVAGLAGFGGVAIGWSCLAALAVFCACFALFAVNAMGGGDAKLLTAVALWYGFNISLFEYLVTVAFVGGVLTLVILLIRSKADRLLSLGLRLPASLVTARKIPYGIAIAIGGILTFGSTPLAGLIRTAL